MKIKIKKLESAAILLLIVCAVFMTMCENKNETISIVGTWKVKTQSVSGELQNVNSIPDNASYSDISLAIPNNTGGNISGNTFYNSIYADFEIKENQQQINFKNYAGTRIAEDDLGFSFGENLRSTVNFNISDSELIFKDSQNKTVIIFIHK
jgi:heat shock protein HslJ